jgi:hypothetical protein
MNALIVLSIVVVVMYILSRKGEKSSRPKLKREQYDLFMSELKEAGVRADVLEEFEWRFDKGVFSTERDLVDLLEWQIDKLKSEYQGKSVAEISDRNTDYWAKASPMLEALSNERYLHWVSTQTSGSSGDNDISEDAMDRTVSGGGWGMGKGGRGGMRNKRSR